MNLTLGELTTMIGGHLEGDKNKKISGYSKIEEGHEDHISFFANAKYESHVYNCSSMAIIIPTDYRLLKPISNAIIRVPNVYEAVGKLMALFARKLKIEEDVSSQAFISPSATLGVKCSVGPNVIIGDDAEIGDGVTIYGQVFIGNNCKIGSNTIIYPGVVIYHYCSIGSSCIIHANAVIGSDGFGFSQDENGKFNKIQQNGGVTIADNVEIGANTVIDRGSIGDTLIQEGVKLDNLIQIGHNAEIDTNTAIAAQSGISGSTKIGKNCLVGGQVGFVGHIQVADGTMIQAKSGIASSITTPNKKFYGYPAMPYQDYLKSYAYFRKFPDIITKIRDMEKELDLLKQKFSE